MSAHDAMVALARDLVEEIAAGRALELAAQAAAPPPAGPAGPVSPAQVPPAKKGAAAVYPGLGGLLAGRAGDTISEIGRAHV